MGLRDPTTGALGTDASLFDTDTQLTLTAGNTLTAANFVGGNAETAYGALLGTAATPVPLTILSNGETYFHVANASSDPLGHDLMNGIGLTAGTSVDISQVDLAMLRDAGAPVTPASSASHTAPRSPRLTAKCPSTSLPSAITC